MNIDQYYRPEEMPPGDSRKRMWNAISRATRTQGGLPVVRDTRSFLTGMAASVILFLSAAGAYSLVDGFLESRQPHEIRFDDAYRSAIKEFESVIPSTNNLSASEPAADLLQSKLNQLKLVDEAIAELHSDIAKTDLSPLKHNRLRRLYSMKLKVLQEIIQQGGIEL